MALESLEAWFALVGVNGQEMWHRLACFAGRRKQHAAVAGQQRAVECAKRSSPRCDVTVKFAQRNSPDGCHDVAQMVAPACFEGIDFVPPSAQPQDP